MEKLKQIGFILLMILCIFIGLGMIEMAFTDPDFEIASRIFMVVCGLIFIAPGVLVLVPYVGEIVNKKGDFLDILRGKNISKQDIYDSMKGVLVPDFNEVKTDRSETGKLLRTFRRDYHDFFMSEGVKENSALQSDATQILLNVLTLQKKRLDRKGIQLETISTRWSYGKSSPVSVKTFFDGKYEISQVQETIRAERIFKKGNKIISKFRTSDIAKYRLLSAKSQGGKEVTCPNCGSVSTREDLLDGCDFCGTKFTVEDLGTRVSDYSLQRDYEVEYERYKAKRQTYGYRVGFGIGIPVFIFSLIGMIIAAFETETGIMMKIAVALIGAGFCTFAAVYLGLCFFYFFIFPIIQSKSSLVYLSKKQFAAWKSGIEKDKSAEMHVRKEDSLFSIEGFYAELTNKLAMIHFAESREAATAFAVGDATSQIAASLSNYNDVIDMRVDSIHLDRYNNDRKMQTADVSVVLSLLQEDGKREIKEKLHLRLIKHASCMTQAVCAPSLLKCEGCGGSLSLVEGLVCEHCGTKADIPKVTWAILNYKE